MQSSLLLLLWGCRPPPDAPQNLDDLMSYLFEHTRDERPDAMIAGIENLSLWLESHLEETFDGYRVTNLSSESVANLDDRTHNLDGQVGAAVGYDVLYPFEQVTDALVTADPLELFPDVYESHDRTYLSDYDCFVDKSCDLMSFDSTTTFNYPLNLTIETTSRTDYRWLELSDGQYASVQRVWMLEPATINVDWVQIDQQYFIATSIPVGDITRRVEATWAIVRLGDGAVSEELALNLTISNMQKTGERITTYIENQE